MKRLIVTLGALTMLALTVSAGAAERRAVGKSKPKAVGCYLDPLELDNSGKGNATASAAVVVGRTIIIRLKCTPPAAIWSLRNGKVEGDALEQVGRAKRVIIRSGGRRVREKYFFTFRAVKPGAAKLVLEYKRAWEKDKPPLETFTLTATVKPDPTPDRVKKLKANINSFTLMLRYHGPQNELLYRSLVLSVPQIDVDPIPGFDHVTISKKQAEKIIDHLAKDGFLAQAVSLGKRLVRPPGGTYYSMQVNAGKMRLHKHLGWDLKMLERLDGLQKVLDGEAAKAMDKLLKCLEGQRKEWTKKKSITKS